MLAKLFGSKARVSLLKIFLMNAGEKFYVRELSRRLELAVNSISRELDNLESLGLLASSLEIYNGQPAEVSDSGLFPGTEADPAPGDLSSGSKKKSAKSSGLLNQQRKYYRVRPDFALLEEIKKLIIRSQVLYEKDFADKIKNIGSLKLLVLTGIFAGNDTAPVDILLVGKINRPKFISLIGEMEKELQKELNFTIMDPAEFKYRKDITDIFLYNILEGNKLVLVDEIGLL
jgi:hypothetical protein